VVFLKNCLNIVVLYRRLRARVSTLPGQIISPGPLVVPFVMVCVMMGGVACYLHQNGCLM
jgi:hypothetical protein